MLRRVAELPWPLRYLLIAIIAIIVLCILCWVDKADESRVELHVRASHPLGIRLAPSLARWYRVDVPASQVDDALAAMRRDPFVDEAFVAPVVSLPSVDDGDACPITTPAYDHLQGYLAPAPDGIDAAAAWRRGDRGGGVWFADVEGGWNARHEDLPGDRISLVHGSPVDAPGWREHGTAVLGEVVGIANGRGVTGIAPDVERVVTASIGSSTSAAAIAEAARQLRAGDVLLVELQGLGPLGRFMPVEYWDDNFDAIAAATARGVVVIEAAGNGGENLDRALYRGKLDRKKRDSGAIVVGAGAPPRTGFSDRARLDFSNYGTRVDVQGWGRRVATLDYGDLQRCDDDTRERHYTDEFSGTSSASPIVAGAAILLESLAQRTLSPVQVRAVLAAAGSPQTGNTREHIGPRPDLAEALSAIERSAMRSR